MEPAGSSPALHFAVTPSPMPISSKYTFLDAFVALRGPF
jgi:hypothetical protein